MPLWVSALVSGWAACPGTWILSAQGAHTAHGQYIHAVLIGVIALAVALPLYYYRHRIVTWVRQRTDGDAGGGSSTGA